MFDVKACCEVIFCPICPTILVKSMKEMSNLQIISVVNNSFFLVIIFFFQNTNNFCLQIFGMKSS